MLHEIKWTTEVQEKGNSLIYDDLIYSGWVSTMVLMVHQPRVPTNRPIVQKALGTDVLVTGEVR